MDALDRMFHTLVRNIRDKQPALLTAPFSVSDIHQHILPYRHFRRELGLETNQEYELVLMELLTGARGYLDVDERLRDNLGRELMSSSPEPSRVRDFADAQVAIKPAALDAIGTAGTAPAPQGAPAAAPASSTAGVSGGPARATTDAPRCRYCGGDLPPGRTLNYCPHCGQNLQVKNCPACGAEVEAGWRFCVVCGKSVVSD
ncbi:MAG TPA: zinc ribbon domain-containing protein [Gemmatimonadaceae bacterium]|nr:zinc ribbon domain-containing protein [Gemmatimonadaceae bacterium]